MPELPPDRTGIQLADGRTLNFGLSPLVMGIINTTPDSFSDGGVHLNTTTAVSAALAMASEGAAVIDIGGESTRPGADAVALDEELRRVIPVIERIRKASDVPISIDTMKARVAELALDAGANIVNDITAMRFDSEMARVVRERRAPVILMHMRGTPRTMQGTIHYDDLMGEIHAELRSWTDLATGAGIARKQILIDPGIGFGKTFEHNLLILSRARGLSEIAPVVIGASRKAFIGAITGRSAGPGRVAGSLATAAAARSAGAAMVRVHDVAATLDFFRTLDAIEESRA